MRCNGGVQSSRSHRAGRDPIGHHRILRRVLAPHHRLALLLALISCAGRTAREDSLWPAVCATWPTIRHEVVDGIRAKGESPESFAVLSTIDRAVLFGDSTSVSGVSWSTLLPFAKASIDARVQDGSISEGVAVSMRERLHQFNLSMRQLGAL